MGLVGMPVILRDVDLSDSKIKGFSRPIVCCGSHKWLNLLYTYDLYSKTFLGIAKGQD